MPVVVVRARAIVLSIDRPAIVLSVGQPAIILDIGRRLMRRRRWRAVPTFIVPPIGRWVWQGISDVWPVAEQAPFTLVLLLAPAVQDLGWLPFTVENSLAGMVLVVYLALLHCGKTAAVLSIYFSDSACPRRADWRGCLPLP